MTAQRNVRIFAIFLLVTIVAAGSWASGRVEPTLPGLLVEGEWVAANLDHENVVILDTGRSMDDYLAGHVPNAVYFDRSIYYGEVNGTPGMFTGVDSVGAALRDAGVNDDSIVILYDSGHGLWATRLFWTLELLGHEHAAVLNGGSGKWAEDNRASSTTVKVPRPGNFAAYLRPELVVDGEGINSEIDSFTVIDARSSAEFEGSDIRAARGGHIPGAINIDWVLNNNSDGATAFLPATELGEFYDAELSGQSGTIVTHCQTGVRGAHTYFVLRLLGYEDVALYDASWVEWGNSEVFPVSTALN